MKKGKEKYRKIAVLPFILLFAAGVAMLFLPDKKISKTERRYLADFPQVSANAIADGSYMKKIEVYLKDQMLGRDFFRSIKAETETTFLGKRDIEGYYRIEDEIYQLETELSEKNVVRAAKQFREISETYFPDAQIYLAIIPDKNVFAPKNTDYPCLDYEKIEQLMQEHFACAEYIQIADYLELADYYRTDLHWRQEKIIDVAQILLERMNPDEYKQKEESYQQVELAEECFLGGYAGASAFYIKPEPMYYVTNQTIEQAKLYDYESECEREIYAWEELQEETDPYNFFLNGPRALLTLQNPRMKGTGKKLLLFRDSFGSSAAPLLLEDYEEITLVDLRYVSVETASERIEFDEYDTVLFLYSSLMLHHSNSIKF